MTLEEFLADFEDSLYTSFNINKQRSPYKTGNLRENGIKILKTPNGYKIWVDETVAPYAVYLDNYPSIKKRYPEGWFGHIGTYIVTDLIKKYDRKTYNEKYKETHEDILAGRKIFGADKAMREWNRKNNTPIIVKNPARDSQR